jgi:hypothetical protein
MMGLANERGQRAAIVVKFRPCRSGKRHGKAPGKTQTTGLGPMPRIASPQSIRGVINVEPYPGS